MLVEGISSYLLVVSSVLGLRKVEKCFILWLRRRGRQITRISILILFFMISVLVNFNFFQCLSSNVCSKRIETEAVFTKTEITNESNIDFLQISPLSIQHTYSEEFSVGQGTPFWIWYEAAPLHIQILLLRIILSFGNKKIICWQV